MQNNDIRNVFKMVKKDLSMDKMIQLNEDNFNDFFNLTTRDIKTYEELKSLFEKYDVDVNKVYFTFDHLYPVWYIDPPMYSNLQHLLCVEDMFLRQANSYKKYLNDILLKNDWERLMLNINDVFSVDHFIRHYDEIPKNQINKILCNLYTSREYILNKLDIDIIKKTFSGYNVSRIPSDKINDNNLITIYRGQTYASTPLQEALSWSLDESVARWFANRFNSNGKIYKGKVKLQDVMLYTNSRNEQEVLVEFKDIKDVEVI